VFGFNNAVGGGIIDLVKGGGCPAINLPR
jgi:hypothetical protein